MAVYFLAEGEDASEVARSLLELADDPQDVVFLPSVTGGNFGGFVVRDDVADAYSKIKSEHEAEEKTTTRKSRRSKAAEGASEE